MSSNLTNDHLMNPLDVIISTWYDNESLGDVRNMILPSPNVIELICYVNLN